MFIVPDEYGGIAGLRCAFMTRKINLASCRKAVRDERIYKHMKEKTSYVPVEARVVNETEKGSTPLEGTKERGEVKKGHMRLIDGLRMKKVAGQTLLYPTAEAASKVYQPAMLNKEATVLVNMMKEDFTVDTIVEQGLKIYRVEEAVLRKDVEKLVDNLMLAGMLEGEEVERRLKKASTSISGTAVLKDEKVVASKVENIKRLFSLKKSDK